MATASDIIKERSTEFEGVLEHLQAELKGLRTGRAATALVETLPIEAYGTTQSLRDVSQISVPESRQILIQPWDKSIMKDIEKAIQLSPLGVNPVNDGAALRITLPPLTEDRRKELTKVVGAHAESARISVRNVRESVMKELKRLQEEGDISEDERFRAEDQLQKKVDEANQQIREIAEAKETEIMTV